MVKDDDSKNNINANNSNNSKADICEVLCVFQVEALLVSTLWRGHKCNHRHNSDEDTETQITNYSEETAVTTWEHCVSSCTAELVLVWQPRDMSRVSY